MYLKSKLPILLALPVIMASCSSPRMLGTWNISKFEVTRQDASNSSVTNAGVVTFMKGNQGVKNISLAPLGVQQADNTPFTWSQNAGTITVTSDNSEFSKTWIVIKDSRKKQVWRSSESGKNVATIELTKAKSGSTPK